MILFAEICYHELPSILMVYAWRAAIIMKKCGRGHNRGTKDFYPCNPAELRTTFTAGQREFLSIALLTFGSGLEISKVALGKVRQPGSSPR
jgi:hypothetical protein